MPQNEPIQASLKSVIEFCLSTIAGGFIGGAVGAVGGMGFFAARQFIRQADEIDRKDGRHIALGQATQMSVFAACSLIVGFIATSLVATDMLDDHIKTTEIETTNRGITRVMKGEPHVTETGIAYRFSPFGIKSLSLVKKEITVALDKIPSNDDCTAIRISSPLRAAPYTAAYLPVVWAGGSVFPCPR